VLTCSDSRVPPELIFGVGLGDIFVVRVAGNVVLGATVIGSLEYAVHRLHVPLIVVMGHTCCGALKAAEAGPGDGSCVGDIVNEIRTCFEGGDNLRANVRRQAAKLPERSKTLGAEVKAGRLKIKGAIYHLESGKVEML
jgi:carbonic anhydrase